MQSTDVSHVPMPEEYLEGFLCEQTAREGLSKKSKKIQRQTVPKKPRGQAHLLQKEKDEVMKKLEEDYNGDFDFKSKVIALKPRHFKAKMIRIILSIKPSLIIDKKTLTEIRTTMLRYLKAKRKEETRGGILVLESQYSELQEYMLSVLMEGVREFREFQERVREKVKELCEKVGRKFNPRCFSITYWKELLQKPGNEEIKRLWYGLQDVHSHDQDLSGQSTTITTTPPLTDETLSMQSIPSRFPLDLESPYTNVMADDESIPDIEGPFNGVEFVPFEGHDQPELNFENCGDFGDFVNRVVSYKTASPFDSIDNSYYHE